MTQSLSRLWGRAGTVLVWTALLGLSAVLSVAILIPKLGGATPYTVLTSSMEPDLPAGTLVVVKPIDAKDIGVGTVITYQLHSAEPEVVTHRVVSQAFGKDGRPIYRTQGDANDAADSGWVRSVQVKGALWYSVPQLGYVNSLVTGDQRSWLVNGAALLLFGYAAMMFGLELRSRRRSRSADPGSESADEPVRVAHRLYARSVRHG